MHRELIARGLTVPATPKQPERPLGKSSVHRMLTNPYYRGLVQFQGVTYRGVHEPLVPPEVWYQVQTILDTHRSAADATQIHDHYLKGTVFCGQCGSRLLVTHARSSKGSIYPYFMCAGRHSGRTDCTRQAMLISQVEELIERYYRTIQVSAETRYNVAGMLHSGFDKLMTAETNELENLATQRVKLEGEQLKLLQAHYAGAVPLDLLKREHDRISAALELIEIRIEAHHGGYVDARSNLDDALALLEHADEIYARADDANRRLCNQAFFRAIYIDEDNDIRAGYATPFDALCDPELQADALTWAASAKQEAGSQSSSEGGPSVESLNPARLG